jgi:peptidoglycan-associated lipoprotein
VVGAVTAPDGARNLRGAIRTGDSFKPKGEDRMNRDIGRLVPGIVLAGLIGIVALGGCTKKNVASTTSGTETSQAGAVAKSDAGQDAMARRGDGQGGKGDGQGGKGDGGAGGGSGPGAGLAPGGGPLTPFSKSPSEERVGPSSTMVAKADQAEIDARKAREAALQALKDVYFAYDKWALSQEGQKNLAESADFLRQNPASRLVIEGHCDERGSREYNLVLGEKRAKEVRRYLADLGIKNAVSINSYGKERPVCSEHEESCYWKNRRAHLAVDAGK